MSLEEAAAALDRLLDGNSEKPLNVKPKVSISEVTPKQTYGQRIKQVCREWRNNSKDTKKEQSATDDNNFQLSLFPIRNELLDGPEPNSTVLNWEKSLPTAPDLIRFNSVENVVVGSTLENGSPMVEFVLTSNPSSIGLECIPNLSLDNFYPMDPIKYRTELCRSFQVHGICKYGIKCNFAHGVSQLKVAFRHGKYKTKNCHSYHRTGYCRYGSRCSFIHDPEEGILKCAITEREALEALHYHPMNDGRHHIATITWRLLGTHAGTQIREIKDPNSSSMSTSSDSSDVTPLRIQIKKPKPAEEIRIEKLINIDDETSPTSAVPPEPIKPNCTSKVELKKKANPQIVSNKPQPTNVPSEEPKIEMKDSKRNHCVKRSTASFINSVVKKNDLKPKISRKCVGSFKKELPKSNVKVPPKSPKFHENVYQKQEDPYCPSVTGSIKSFKVDDFFRCLQTPESQHHLAPWSPELDKKCSSFEISKYSESTSGETYGVKDLTKYKTELCRSYQYNQRCDYGDGCLYAHGIRDLKQSPRHPKYRSKKCYSFHFKGFCLYGSRCQFLHDIEYPFQR